MKPNLEQIVAAMAAVAAAGAMAAAVVEVAVAVVIAIETVIASRAGNVLTPPEGKQKGKSDRMRTSAFGLAFAFLIPEIQFKFNTEPGAGSDRIEHSIGIPLSKEFGLLN